MRTYDCAPTLNDTQVLEFCRNGFLMLEGIVPDEINRRTFAFLDAHPSGEPVEILKEDWFVNNVILHPEAAGAVRSLLGANFGLPVLMSNHRVQCPMPAQGWHRDGGSKYGPQQNYLQVFYYPQDCPVELGPTELVPGSHFLFSLSTYMGHYGHIRGGVKTTAPAGSIFISVYSVWHRRSASTAEGLRNMLKYSYWRTVPPQRDWVIDPDFDLATAEYGLAGPTFRQQFRDRYDAAEMYFWLCGRMSEFRLIGGQGWPHHADNFLDKPYGMPPEPLKGLA
ncbi:MAG: phytanoyl-CoA dioxygenase family protein [Candidatus Poribacteria bacterium]|nr:phytanoyl-CoA dioxygenase family protein [Candidatus Poribacteria bacterium]